jgi:hypothetical protein
MLYDLTRLLQKMTPQEQAEVETFAAFVLACRQWRQQPVSLDDIPSKEMLQFVMQAGGFDWLNTPEQNVYTIRDGESVEWPVESSDAAA